MLSTQKLKELSLLILAIVTLCSCHSKNNKSQPIQYGWESRLMSTLIDMNCTIDNMAIYNQYEAYRFSEGEYEIQETDREIGESNFVFKIALKDTSTVIRFKDASISFCQNGKVYIGRGQQRTNAHFPPACHFYFLYDDDGNISNYKNGVLTCSSTPFLSLDEYAEKVLGVKR